MSISFNKIIILQRNVASTNNLDTLIEVHLKVSFNMLGLQRLNTFLPKLLSLNLDGSFLKSLRDLGSNLSVQYLNISRCGLTNFDGTNGLTSVQHLVADGNFISNLQPLCNLNNLRILSMRRYVYNQYLCKSCLDFDCFSKLSISNMKIFAATKLII